MWKEGLKAEQCTALLQRKAERVENADPEDRGAVKSDHSSASRTFTMQGKELHPTPIRASKLTFKVCMSLSPCQGQQKIPIDLMRAWIFN